jgi:hypothetical protein
MTDTVAAFFEQSACDGFLSALRGYAGAVVRNLGLGLGAVAAIGIAAVGTAVTAGWIVHSVLSTNTRLVPHGATATQTISLRTATVSQGPQAPPAVMLQDRVARARALAQEMKVFAPDRIHKAQKIASAPPPIPKPRIVRAESAAMPAPAAMQVARASRSEIDRETSVPLPQRRPARGIAPAADVETPPRLAALPPPAAETRPVEPPAERQAPILPGTANRTAVYDIAAHTVYLPDGRRLEAHSGLGERMDDPDAVRVRMRGPTPPNVYQLTLREKLFHGVQAIRLNPIDESKMFGRDGMLAHTYMLGPSGQSNGCVSFKKYDVFLRAFLNGEVDRMVVVKRLEDAPALAASLRRARADRYALND